MFYSSIKYTYMKKNILKQVAGIDVAQKELVVTLGRIYEDLSVELYAHKAFINNEKGFLAFTQWIKKLCSETAPLRFVLEATGVYHESLAYYLHDNGYELSIVLPNKISNYVKTLEIKTITDKTASQAIARFGLERSLEVWHKPKKIYKQLRQLSRERDQIVTDRTIVKNQIHAEEVEAEPGKKSLSRMKERLRLLDKQEKQVVEELEQLVQSDEDMQRIMLLICSLPGVGLLTAVTVLAETNGFELVRNKKQLVSYAGLDVKEKLSGTSVKGKAKISKRGNRYLRKALYFPAFTAIRWDGRFKAIYDRLVAKHGIKMKAAVAIQRKLLELIYAVFSTGKPYEKDYLQRQEHSLQAKPEEITSPGLLGGSQPPCSGAAAA
jgi:transposase